MNDTNKTILLIEEDETLREITRFRLELLGYRVTALGRGDDALAWLSDKLPNAIIVGHYLPDMEGPDLIDRLSNDLRTSESPVLLMSPNAELEDVKRAFNAGADDYLVTPFDPLTLEQKLKRLTDSVGV